MFKNKEITFTTHHPMPVRTFVTKFEHEINSNRKKSKSRQRERDSKYSTTHH